MPEVFKENILRLLRHSDYRPLKVAQLARELGVSEEDYPQFKKAFEQLRDSGGIITGGGGVISLPPLKGRIIGTFRLNPKGFGFVMPREPMRGDLFIPPKYTADAMTGDVVAAKVLRKRGKRGGEMLYSGEVVEILERANNRFVGTLRKKKAMWFVEPDGKQFLERIYVDDVTAKGAREKDKVVVEIISYPTEFELGRGAIIEVLGKAGRYESEIRSVIRQFHLPDEFDEQCRRQASEVGAKFNAKKAEGREDVTDKMIITIDPPDAKDFDDAISLEKDDEGRWILGVHIADVSYFVKEETRLDEEARLRGNSVYLPGKTIPMLPEVLSNGVCSLQQGQKRFVKSVYITYDKAGNVVGRRVTESVMKSAKRLTYLQADRILKGHTKDIEPEVIKLLKDMDRLSRIIEKRREKNGMLHLDLPETELIMDKAGQVVDAQPADDSYPHTIIEMFMVEANEAVAQLLEISNAEFIRRIHPEPDSLSMKGLAKIVRLFGYGLAKSPGRMDLQNLLNAVKGKENELAVNLIVLRSLEKAVYSPLKVGHFALASNHYCHFTSPIRRYADLVVHRVIENYLRGKKPVQNMKQDLMEAGRHISFTERQAEDAEHELKAVLILQMLSKRIGDDLDCVVTGTAGFGVFVQCKKFGIEGLITIDNLGADEWKYNQKAMCLEGVNSGVVIRLGMGIRVKIVSVNVAARQLNLAPAEPLIDYKKIEKKKQRQKRRQKTRTQKRIFRKR